MSRKWNFLLIGCMLILQLAACSTKDDEAAMLSQTLQAIYLQDTQEAMGIAMTEIANAQAEEPAAPAAEVAATATSEPAPAPSITPGNPPDSERTLEDSDASLRSYENRVLSGDNILNNLYERPFTSIDMIYQPDLDIYTVDIAFDEPFYYFTITLNGLNEDAWALTGTYGIEFDRTANGRGDLLVLVENPSAEWSTDNVTVWKDTNKDVGGPKPIVADENFNGTGYDTQVEMSGDSLAFARVSPDDSMAVQIAVSSALLENPESFLWGAWADGGLKDISMLDYNDAISSGAAGSPFKDSSDYPIKALYSVDNTCRLAYGFGIGAAPGMCTSAPPPSKEDDPDKTELTCPPGCWLIGDHCECIE